MENCLLISDIKEGMRIEYIGERIAFGGKYLVVAPESTYLNASDCPVEEKGKLMIIEFMNDDTPMFFRVDKLNLNEWRLAV